MYCEWILELDEGCWKADFSGVTVVYENARKYKTISAATHALAEMRFCRPYRNAKIYTDSEYMDGNNV